MSDKTDPTKGPIEAFHSLPDMREPKDDDKEDKWKYSVSLSHIRDYTEFGDYHFKPSPFNIRWINGYSSTVGVLNLNDEGSTVAFYAASNCGVLYNWTTNTMRILQGHRHMVTCIASDEQGKWLVTADTGPENIIIIWDAKDYFPQKTLFSPHGDLEIAKVALSADAKYLLTLAYKDNARISWWIWSFGLDVPHASIEEAGISPNSVIAMECNPDRTEQFLLLTKNDIWIGMSGKIYVMERGVIKETENYELKLRRPQKKVQSDFGRFTCFTFVKKTSQVLVPTSRGGVAVYGYTIDYKQDVDSSNIKNLRFVKLLKVEKCSINVIKSIDGVIVTGNSRGQIHFYDDQMKLMYWVHEFVVDCVRGLAFNISPRSYMILDPKCNKKCYCCEQVEAKIDPLTGAMSQKLIKKKIPTDATTSGKLFVVRDFLVCTDNEGVGFVDFVTEKLVTIMNFKTSPAQALTVHPEKPFFCLGYKSGIIELVNFTQHKLIERLDLRATYKTVILPKEDSINCNYEITLPELSVSCLMYSPSGLHLACGLNTGQLLFLDPTTIDILTAKPFQDTSFAIKRMNYSCDSLTFAFSDAGKTVCVYKYDCDNQHWNFIGKHRAHYKEINAVFFLPRKNDNGDYKLLTLGADRIMVEYDIGSSSDEHLEVLSLDRMDQSAVPLTGIPWPMPKEINQDDCRSDLPMILVSNDAYKYKIVNYDTTMTLATILGPRYEHPVSKIQMVTKMDDPEQRQYLLFATKNVIGLQKLPLDGNPWKHVGLLGHPNKVTTMCFREDRATLFTIGSKDSSMCQWAANYKAVENTTKLGGVRLDPYYCLIENGRPGWLFQEIRDLFYYIQILCQGTFSPALRRVIDCIPIDSLPDLMRALGFFPSEYEVENLLIEAKYNIYQRHQRTEIDFEEFVKLYLNHRPALGERFNRVKNAFKHFAETNTGGELWIDRDDFVDMLGNYGECFSRELSWYLLSILSGQSSEDRAAMVQDDFSFLPEALKFSELVTNLIGIQDMEPTKAPLEPVFEPTQSEHTSSSLDSDNKMP